jgi:hypothetical protein
MRVRWTIGIAAACAALAACEGANGFTGSQVGLEGGGGARAVGAITGSVIADGSGRGGVSVILVGRDSTTTDGSGAFTFSAVPAGTWQVSVRVPLGMTLAAGQTGTRTVTVADGGTSGATFILQSTTTVP